jgi:hypothetical protein
VIEKMSRTLDDVLPEISTSQFVHYKEDLYQAWFTVKFGGLKTISENSDTRMWEYAGMKQRCKNCPDQDYEPYFATIEDYTGEYGQYPPMTLKDF